MSDVQSETKLAKVVHVVDSSYAPFRVVINRGSREGIKVGDRFLIFAKGPHIVDPDTGSDLGELEIVRGRGEVVHIQDHLATIHTIERQRARPTKRIVRDSPFGTLALFGARASGQLVEEELPADTEVPFESVRLGDLAKPI